MHFVKVYAHVFAALLAAMFLGAGVELTGSVLAGVAVAAVSSFVMLALGVGSLIVVRQVFNLMQAGRLAQLGSFWLIWTLVVKATGWLVPSVLTVTSAGFTGLFMLGAALLLASVTGNLSMFGRRSWLPVKRPTDQ